MLSGICGGHSVKMKTLGKFFLCPALAAILGAPVSTARAQSFDAGWLAFGDLYTVPSHHTKEGEGATGAVLRRAYLTFNAEFTENIFGRVRFEANQDGEFEVYEYDADFKDLYLGWRFGGHSLVAGLSSTITFDVIEKKWGARYLMRTPLDLQGLPSRDTGVMVKGPISEGTWTFIPCVHWPRRRFRQRQ